MLSRSSSRILQLFLFAVAVAGLDSRANAAAVIASSGYDLLPTVSANFNFMGAGGLGNVDFKGKPLGTFDFGSGAVNVGSTTDTIVHRLENAMDSEAPVAIEMVALSLQSVTAINWSGFGGLASEVIFATLERNYSDSNMTVRNNGTFDSILHFDIRLQGALSGAFIVVEKTFTQSGANWLHVPTDPNTVLINGINSNLNGTNNTTDFFLNGAALHDTGNGRHVVGTPEPGSFTVFGIAGLISLIALRKRMPPQANLPVDK